MRRTAAVALILLTSASFAGISMLPQASAATLFVGGTGLGNYTTIQSAVNTAHSGDTVFVYNGTYYENIVINKGIALIGENKNTTTIDGTQRTNTIRVTRGPVNISGFTIRNSSRHGYEADSGIYAEEVGGSSFTNNIFVDNGKGISGLDSHKITIDGNVMRGNWDGIYLTGSLAIVSRNLIVDNHFGIEAFHFTESVLVNNTIAYNSESVALWYTGSGSRIYHNNIVNNDIFPCDDSQYDSGINKWDNGYPSGGNFWGYDCIDEMSGPSQDEPGGDGICDRTMGIEICHPHLPWEMKFDRYPLAYPIYPLGLFPRGPTNSDARLSGENVTLSWSLSPDDGTGSRNVVGYKIFRNTTYEKDPAGYPLLASIPNGTETFVDSLAGEGDPSDYFYCVCAFDASDNTACAMEQTGKFTRPLSTGLNLISVPLTPSNQSIDTVLQTVEYNKAWSYDSFSREWKSYMKSKGYRRDLWNINHMMGLWVNVTAASNLTVAGKVPAITSIHLAKGWNLVGFPSFKASHTVWRLKVEAQVERVEGFDSSVPPHFLSVLPNPEIFLPGQGYWVKANEDSVWIVSNR